MRVLLLEAGGSDRNFWIRLPVGYFRTIYDPRFSRLFDDRALRGHGRARRSSGRAGACSAARRRSTASSSSAASTRISTTGRRRAPPAGTIARCCRSSSAPSATTAARASITGRTGELGVSRLRNDHPYCRAVGRRRRAELGCRATTTSTAPSTYGVGAYQLGIRDGWRSSAARRLPAPGACAAEPHGRSPARTSTRVLFEGTARHAACEWIDDGERRQRARAEREVILAAGTLQSPQLLQLSGIGPGGAAAASTASRCVVDAPEVGENLQDHYQARTIVRLKKKLSLNDHVRNPSARRNGAAWLFAQLGPAHRGRGAGRRRGLHRACARAAGPTCSST